MHADWTVARSTRSEWSRWSRLMVGLPRIHRGNPRVAHRSGGRDHRGDRAGVNVADGELPSHLPRTGPARRGPPHSNPCSAPRWPSRLSQRSNRCCRRAYRCDDVADRTLDPDRELTGQGLASRRVRPVRWHARDRCDSARTTAVNVRSVLHAGVGDRARSVSCSASVSTSRPGRCPIPASPRCPVFYHGHVLRDDLGDRRCADILRSTRSDAIIFVVTAVITAVLLDLTVGHPRSGSWWPRSWRCGKWPSGGASPARSSRPRARRRRPGTRPPAARRRDVFGAADACRRPSPRRPTRPGDGRDNPDVASGHVRRHRRARPRRDDLSPTSRRAVHRRRQGSTAGTSSAATVAGCWTRTRRENHLMDTLDDAIERARDHVARVDAERCTPGYADVVSVHANGFIRVAGAVPVVPPSPTQRPTPPAPSS